MPSLESQSSPRSLLSKAAAGLIVWVCIVGASLREFAAGRSFRAEGGRRIDLDRRRHKGEDILVGQLTVAGGVARLKVPRNRTRQRALRAVEVTARYP